MTDETLLQTSIAPARAVDPWARLSRVTGIVGLSTLVLIFTPIVAISTLGEPSFTATAEEAHAFLVNASVGWARLAMAVLPVAAIGLVWFVVGLTLLLARAEGSPPWRSVGALVAGVLLPAHLLLDASWGAAAYRGAETEPGLARYAFDVGNLGFANAWVAMGSFAVACGWVVLSTRVFGRWLGWWAVVAGVGLVVARFVWTNEFWYRAVLRCSGSGWSSSPSSFSAGGSAGVVSHDRADRTIRRHHGARGSRVRGRSPGPTPPGSACRRFRCRSTCCGGARCPGSGTCSRCTAGPGRAGSGTSQFVGLLLGYLGLMAVVASVRRPGPARFPARGRGQRRAAADRGRVLARLRAAHSVGPRCRPGGAARRGLAAASADPNRLHPTREEISHA